MLLYLVQHGEALSDAEDPTRPLSETGRAHAAAVATHLAQSGIVVHAIYHSGKLRAQQTAETFAEQLEPTAGVRELEGLAPKDDPAIVVESFAEFADSTMLVGHLPHLDRLASLLIAGHAEGGVVGFRNAGAVALTESDGHWTVAWIVTPEVAGPPSPS